MILLALLTLMAWALFLGWLISPWLELAALLFWTVALLWALEREHRTGRRWPL